MGAKVAAALSSRCNESDMCNEPYRGTVTALTSNWPQIAELKLWLGEVKYGYD